MNYLSAHRSALTKEPSPCYPGVCSISAISIHRSSGQGRCSNSSVMSIHESNSSESPPGTEARKRYEERLDKLLDEDVGHFGKDFQTLQNGIIKCQDFLFTFLDHEGVPHHNNASEAAIRILKVKTKVSGGFRTQKGADEFAVFHSIMDTAKRNGKSKFKTLYQLVVEEAPNASFIDKHIV